MTELIGKKIVRTRLKTRKGTEWEKKVKIK